MAGFFFFIKEVVDIIWEMVKAFLIILEFVSWLITNIPFFIKLAVDILTPSKLLQQIVSGTFASLGAVYTHIKNMFSGKLFLSKAIPKQRHPSKGFFGHNSTSKQQQKCVRPTWLRLILMVLCPPLALFMKVGLTGWFYVLLCTILTVYGYYFPGLIYATMHILC